MEPREARNYIGTHHLYNQPKPATNPHWWNKHSNTQPIQIMRQSSLTEAASSAGSGGSSQPASPVSASGFSFPGPQDQAPKIIKPNLYQSLGFTD